MATGLNRSGSAPLPALTLLLGPPRSGTTFLQKMLCQYCQGIGIYEPTGVSAYQGIAAGINPYDAILTGRHPHIQRNPGVPVIVKEVQDGVMGAYLARQGHDLSSWVDLRRLGPARILWIFRNPLDVWRSIVAQGWDQTHHPLEVYLDFYADALACYEAMQCQAPEATAVLSYERLIGSLETSLHRIADFAGLAETEGWADAEEGKDLYYKRVHYDPAVRALMESLNAHSSLHGGPSAAKPKPPMEASVEAAIQARLGPLFASIQRHDLLAGEPS